MIKNHCGHMVDPSWTRCGECGAIVQIQEECLEAVKELKELANEFLEDRVMEDWEYDFLLQETKRLGLSSQTLDSMINSYKPLQQANAAMSFDVGSISGFVSGQPCQLRIKIENVSNQPFRKIQFFYRILQEPNPSLHQLKTLPQNSKKNTALSFTPKEPGQYSMNGVMSIQGYRGDTFCYQFEGINFQVVSAQSGSSNITYNIDNSMHQRTEKYGSTAMQGNVNIQKDHGPTSGVFNRAEWKPLSLKPISEEMASDFQLPKTNVESSKTSIENTVSIHARGEQHEKEEEYDEAVRCYRLAADLGYAPSQNALGDCYDSGNGVDHDYEEAFKWYQKAAKQEYTKAITNIGHCYFNGEGIDEDEEKAVKWYRKAIAKGNSEAMCDLGDCYYNGYGVDEDEEEAMKWYKKASKKDNLEGMYRLGKGYYKGSGVVKNKIKGIKLIKKAAKADHSGALKFIKKKGL